MQEIEVWPLSQKESSPGGRNGDLLQYSCLENPRGLPSMGSHRVGHDCRDLAAAAAEELGGLQSMELQRIGHNLVTDQQL